MKIFIALIMTSIVIVMGLIIFKTNKGMTAAIDEALPASGYSTPAFSVVYSNTDSPDIPATYSKYTSSLSHYQHQSATDIKSSAGSINNEKVRRFPSAEKVKESREHLEDLGYITNDNDHVYRQYDISTLEELGDQGDLVALDLLVEKYVEQGETLKQMSTWRKAAMFGSTSATIGLADFSLGYVKDFSDRPEPQQKTLTEGVAWLKFAMMRGDPRIESVLKRQIKELNKASELIDWIKVEKRADEIYQQLERERAARGLPPFENKDLEYMKPLF